jgi:hypothetical protein
MQRYITPRQFAASTGRAYWTVLKACRENRITGAQRVGNQYIIPEDATYVPSAFAGMDDMIALMPAEVMQDVDQYEHVHTAVPAYHLPGNSKANGNGNNTLRAPGLARYKQEHGYSYDALSELTGLSRATLARAVNGEMVYASTIVRLSTSLGIGVSDLLRETA